MARMRQAGLESNLRTITIQRGILIVCLILASCSKDPAQQIHGKWQDAEQSVYEFFPDGTCRISTGAIEYTGRFVFLEDGRLKIEATLLGTTSISLLEDPKFDDERLDFMFKNRPRSWFRYEDARNPGNIVGLWKQGDLSETPYEDANFLRLNRDGTVGVGLGTWFVRSDKLVVNYSGEGFFEGAARESTAHGEATYFLPEVTEKGTVEKWTSEAFETSYTKYSDDSSQVITAFAACFEDMTYRCEDVGNPKKNVNCAASSGPRFAKYEDCLAWCKREGERIESIRCASS